MEDWLLVSHILLWVLAVIQLVLFFILVKLVVDFLNKFQSIDGSINMKALLVGDTAPDFTEKDQSGLSISISKPEHYSKTFLIFAKSTCSSCHIALEKIIEANVKQSRLIVVSSTEFYKDASNNMPMVHFITSNAIINKYHVHQYPQIYVINQLGIIEQITNLTNLDYALKKVNDEPEIAS